MDVLGNESGKQEKNSIGVVVELCFNMIRHRNKLDISMSDEFQNI